MKSIDLNRKQDISKFYNIINSLIQYKSKGKIVKRIKQEDLIIYGDKMNSTVINYFKNLYKDNWGDINFNGHLNYELELDRSIK